MYSNVINHKLLSTGKLENFDEQVKCLLTDRSTLVGNRKTLSGSGSVIYPPTVILTLKTIEKHLSFNMNNVSNSENNKILHVI